MDASQQTVLITGANSGIGLECARIMSNLGYRLILVGRSKERLQEAIDSLSSETEAHMIVSDLSLPSAAIEVMTGVRELGCSIDILINNAGVGLYGALLETDPVKEEDMMQLNMQTLVQLTRLVLPEMVQRGSGRILNVASTAAFFPGPLMAVYYATKAFVLSFSEAIDEELRGTGVTVTALCPGPTSTGFAKTADMGRSRLFKGRIATARDAAQTGISGMLAGKRVVIDGAMNRIMIAFARILPRRLLARLVTFIQGPVR
ncbi:MAG: SDR family oxidoreductase [Candidatus Kerfeldbacteria bacterium]|nr:SDR family oxidoreductase [Candidatus Kerfeldbacteria bacterium]